VSAGREDFLAVQAEFLLFLASHQNYVPDAHISYDIHPVTGKGSFPFSAKAPYPWQIPSWKPASTPIRSKNYTRLLPATEWLVIWSAAVVPATRIQLAKKVCQLRCRSLPGWSPSCLARLPERSPLPCDPACSPNFRKAGSYCRQGTMVYNSCLVAVQDCKWTLASNRLALLWVYWLRNTRMELSESDDIESPCQWCCRGEPRISSGTGMLDVWGIYKQEGQASIRPVEGFHRSEIVASRGVGPDHTNPPFSLTTIYSRRHERGLEAKMRLSRFGILCPLLFHQQGF